MIEGVSAADSVIIMISGKAGIQVGTEKAWKLADENKIPKIIFVNEIDEENVDFTAIVDERIKEMNFEYKAKRDSFRIKPPLTHLLQPEAFEIFKERCVLQGARDAQFKLNRLMQDENRHAMFKELVRE